MAKDSHAPEQHLIYSCGARVVALIPIQGEGPRPLHPEGAVGVVTKSPPDLSGPYRVRFPDGFETSLEPHELVLLSCYKQEVIGQADRTTQADLYQHVILRCVVGSQAFGLSRVDSDIDRRGVYLAPAELHWSLYGAPEQLENEASQEVYWELQKFLILALKANPNVLECLYTPLVETATLLGEELLAIRSCFLSQLAYQTYNGYVASQFRKLQGDLRNHGQVKWKHAMHLLRLLLSGIALLRTGEAVVAVDDHRERLLAIRNGETPWEQVEAWRKQLHHEFDEAYETTALPPRPDYERVNDFLLRARRLAANEPAHDGTEQPRR